MADNTVKCACAFDASTGEAIKECPRHANLSARLVTIEKENDRLLGELKRVSANAETGAAFYSNKILDAFLQAINTSEFLKQRYHEACTSPLLDENIREKLKGAL